MAKSKVFEEPKIYYMFFLFIIIMYILNVGFFKDETFTHSVNILFYLTVTASFIYMTSKRRIKINTVSGNSGKALAIGLASVMGLFIISTFIGFFLGFAEKFMTANSIAMIGAFPQFILLKHEFWSFIIFAFFIATIETVAAIRILDVILTSFKSTYKLNDPNVWVASAVVGISAVFYHIWAKFVPATQQLNIHALMIVFFLFFTTCLLAVKMKEMESAIYYHVGNNTLAMLHRLSWLRIFL